MVAEDAVVMEEAEVEDMNSRIILNIHFYHLHHQRTIFLHLQRLQYLKSGQVSLIIMHSMVVVSLHQ